MIMHKILLKSYFVKLSPCFNFLKSDNNLLKPCFSVTKQGFIFTKYNNVEIKQYKRVAK